MIVRNSRSYQSGYALLLMMIVLLGIGGVVAANFTQEVKHEAEMERYVHNQRVLREAKQALLQYTYNYPNFNSEGPGRLPCPDTNDNGEPGAGAGITTAICESVGRFPWAETHMKFYDARDASGERLWYAVSSNFHNLGGGKIINSDTTGTLTLRDRSGGIMHDGSLNEGIAAIIIAPGAIIERAGTAQDRSSVANRNNPVNYLDLLATGNNNDNSVFENSTGNGFVVGPVEDMSTGAELVNDQIIVITAQEVIEMAEKATLEAYRESLLAYMQMAGDCSVVVPSGAGTTEQRCIAEGGTWTPVYPWLFNYEGITYNTGSGETVDDAVDRLNTYYPGDSDFAASPNYHDDNGRIPTIFTDYFIESGSIGFESRLSGTLKLINRSTGFDTVTLTETFCEDGCPKGTGGDKFLSIDTSLDPEADDGPILTFETDVAAMAFANITDTADADTRLQIVYSVPDTITIDLYFMDEDNEPTGIWTICPDKADDLFDCSRTDTGEWIPGQVNDLKARILHLTVTIEFSGTENFDFESTAASNPVITSANASSHAKIRKTFALGEYATFPATLSAVYEFERHWHAGDNSLDTGDKTYTQGTVDMSDFSLDELTLEIDYYPVLPTWMLTNNWHNAIRMAYSEANRPDTKGTCVVGSGIDNCLKINPSQGGPDDKVSLLLIAREHGWVDDIDDGDLDVHDLTSVFDDGNQNGNTTYYTRRGNDRLLVIEEL